MSIAEPQICDPSDLAASSIDVTVKPQGFGRRLRDLLPGLVLTGAIAAVGFGLNKLPYVSIFSPMILSILLGIVFRNVVGMPAGTQAGITFSLRRILRLAIILLGLQLTLAQIGEVGAAGVAVIVATLVATFVFTTYAGRLLGVEREADAADRRRHVDLRRFGRHRDRHGDECAGRGCRLCGRLRDDLRLDRHVRLSAASRPASPRTRRLWALGRRLDP